MELNDFEKGYLTSITENAVFSITRNKASGNSIKKRYTYDPIIHYNFKDELTLIKTSDCLKKINISHSIKKILNKKRMHFEYRIDIGGIYNVHGLIEYLEVIENLQRPNIVYRYTKLRIEKLKISKKARYDMREIELYNELFKINNPFSNIERIECNG